MATLSLPSPDIIEAFRSDRKPLTAEAIDSTEYRKRPCKSRLLARIASESSFPGTTESEIPGILLLLLGGNLVGNLVGVTLGLVQFKHVRGWPAVPAVASVPVSAERLLQGLFKHSTWAWGCRAGHHRIVCILPGGCIPGSCRPIHAGPAADQGSPSCREAFW